jgi:predicted HAD superfamily Cof-like phosphohydrolase
MTNNEKVKEFMTLMKQEIPEVAILPDQSLRDLRMELIYSELFELEDALDDKDIIEVADGLTDILYVVYGMGHALGIDLDKCFEEVHNSNMSKLGENGEPIYREDGKVLKGPNYFKPNLEKIINAS